MVVNKLDSVLSKTAEITDTSPEVVAHVVSHMFRYLGNFLRYPHAAGVRLQHFGVFRGSLAALNEYIRKHLIRECRKDPTKIPKLTLLWSMRQKLMKDKQRRNFTTRFKKQ